jgi:hypothetical protein
MPLNPRVAIFAAESEEGDLLSFSSLESLEPDRDQRASKIFTQKWDDIDVEASTVQTPLTQTIVVGL